MIGIAETDVFDSDPSLETEKFFALRFGRLRHREQSFIEFPYPRNERGFARDLHERRVHIAAELHHRDDGADENDRLQHHIARDRDTAQLQEHHDKNSDVPRIQIQFVEHRVLFAKRFVDTRDLALRPLFAAEIFHDVDPEKGLFERSGILLDGVGQRSRG